VSVGTAGISLEAEKELTKAFADANALKRKLVAAAKEQQAAEQQIEELRADLRQRLENSVEMNSRLANLQDNPAAHNQLVGEVNANNNAIKLLEQMQEQSKKDIDVVRKKANSARESYVQQIAEIRTLVDRLSERYKALKSDTDVQKALADYNSIANTNLEIKPSTYFVSSVKKLEQLEMTVVSEKIPLRREGNRYYASVVINGKSPQEMIVDAGATSVVLPYQVAVECGVKPEEATITVTVTLADWSRVKSKQVVLDSVRVGKLTAEHVECLVLPSEAQNAPAILGMSFLSRFNFSINGQELVLSKIGDAPRVFNRDQKRRSKPPRKRLQTDGAEGPAR
jgi:clan AA aspartic protease (TIGR02281 family)